VLTDDEDDNSSLFVDPLLLLVTRLYPCVRAKFSLNLKG